MSEFSFSADKAAMEFVAGLEADEGELVLTLSNGCCDGSSVFCTYKEDFKSHEAFKLVAVVSKTPFYIPLNMLHFFANQTLNLTLLKGNNPNEFSLDFGRGNYLRVVSTLCPVRNA